MFYDFHHFKTLFNVRGTILDFQGVINRIPQNWKNLLNNNVQTCIDMKYNVTRPKHVELILKEKKGCRQIYESFIKRENNSPNRWQRDLGDISKDERSQYNLALNNIKETKLKDFQFKINNRILATKSFLFKINKIDSNRCSFCELASESIKHLFVDCPKVKDFWDILKNWLQLNGNINLNITDKNIVFAWPHESDLISYLIIIAKYYIYKTKFKSKQLSIQGFCALLKQKFKNEQYIAKINNTYDKFLKKWSSLVHPLNTM
ncbi:MAG: zinc-binding domain-containing protein [Candidatus Thiodiazotropha endolucinida]|nr:zinc-binding domain-containing protein [Candidatus Thiodiazotropha taylori]MCW4261997.1 zinc-binding domain-containing protein [Candidatus Thiodiazotropha endolucinida]